MKLFNKITNAVFGNRCALCGSALDIEQDCEVCAECDKILNEKLQNASVVIDDINISADKFLFFYADKTVRKMVMDMKVNPLKQNCKYFGKVASECIMKDPVFSDFDIVTYCPRKPSKKRYVGYDHSAMFAKYISEFTGKPFMELLKRREGGKEQKKLNLKQRLTNVYDKFYFNNNFNCKHKKVLLVDDIVTTASTVKECARILKKTGGAVKILVLFILD